MSRSPHVIWDNSTLFSRLPQLQEGDIIATRIRLKVQEEHLLLDLTERGVLLIPSATSQLASRSKTFQARIFSPLMIPGTTAIYDTYTLLDTISHYHEQGYGKVVVKHDRKNAGQGVYLFNNIEEAYSLAANNALAFPFVIQPFIKNSYDLRVIILNDYVEAYQRRNPHNFRNNLHCGGSAAPQELSRDQFNFCKKIMSRGDFPYAHIDLMVTDEGENYLAEINLRGGIRGAKITTEEYKRKVKEINRSLVETLQDSATDVQVGC